MHGILLVDKPEGITSNDLVRIVKRCVKPSKVGHSGTLDPAATGLMVILIGAATRALDYLDESRKGYSLVALLGEETDSGDRDGTVISTSDASGLDITRIGAAVQRYLGVMDQVPPHFSAIKKDGVPMYKLARKGVFPELAPRKIEVFSLTTIEWQPPLLELELICSKGTYARALARDLGRDLGVGGRLERLRRTCSGPFHVKDAVSMDEIVQGGAKFLSTRLIGISAALDHIPELHVLPGEVARLMRGTSVSFPRSRLTLGPDTPRLLKIVSGNGRLLILVRPEPKGADIAMRPVRVFNTWEAEE
ncbi:MAG: tRNA pseudouridine(55) synthase TruB [Desulfomonile tiedjei]|uniref:tRNA pseudouridine synthase B n=1 Tax=Desulfomonile tiedjei TaxID=2358 RepID=A0A9D6Z5P7_9BACT|nr:tRNA pseudouridine(55) synthase TruB [Desulfomonile tiedjei]